MVIATKDISLMDKVRIEIEENGEYKTVWSFAEEGEEQLNVLDKKTYNIGEDTFTFGLMRQEDGKYLFSFLCNIKDKSDAFMTHISLNTLFNSDDENIKVLIETMNFSYSIFIGDGIVLMRTKSLLYVSK